jgi:hypothetical protein
LVKRMREIALACRRSWWQWSKAIDCFAPRAGAAPMPARG